MGYDLFANIFVFRETHLRNRQRCARLYVERREVENIFSLGSGLDAASGANGSCGRCDGDPSLSDLSLRYFWIFLSR